MQLRQQESYPVTPFLTKLFSLQGKNISYRIKNVEKKSIQLKSSEKFSIVQNQNIDYPIITKKEPLHQLTMKGSPYRKMSMQFLRKKRGLTDL